MVDKLRLIIFILIIDFSEFIYHLILFGSKLQRDETIARFVGEKSSLLSEKICAIQMNELL